MRGERFQLPYLHHPVINVPKTTQDWQVVTLTIQLSQTDFKQSNIPQIILQWQICYYSLRSVPGQFTFVIILLIPHSWPLKQLAPIALLTKSRQQLRSRTDAEMWFCQVWRCLQVPTTKSYNKDPNQWHVTHSTASSGSLRPRLAILDIPKSPLS